MAEFSVQMTGLRELEAVMARLNANVPLALEAGLFQWGEETMGESKAHYVPVDTGQLRASGYVLTNSLRDIPAKAQPTASAITAAKRTGRTVSVVLGYGGPATPYALSVHENPRAGKTGGVSPSGKRYKHWATVGQWKYLETPFKNRLSQLPRVLKAAMERAIRRARSYGVS